MKVTFLGTGTSQGIPIIGSKHPVCLSENPKDKRLRVSVLLEWDDHKVVIDCGPDFRQQMLTNNVDKIDGILFTHEHNDHIIGLDDVRPFYFRQGDISIYAHERVIKALKKRFEYVFEVENKYPGAPHLSVNEIENEAFEIDEKKIIPINVMHNSLQVFGYRIDDFAYITDAKTIAEEEIEKLTGVKTLVVNALRIEPHHSHFNLEEALAFISKVQPETAYLTHISHLLGFHDEVEAKLPKGVHLAYDNLKIEI
ncbi:MBL fold metallo-hydrolase [Mesonia maritima]|uniref:Phosphoribosyl 1,2-cyclic phosphate phosphodiesterase n=1 Tax=Mesonia maritima TaxID=1793873 RepID=A0ABU1K608_9FLAO|nr:MBL fold metallo-hydrolase [Mesonia maritima]MDR6301046.1 phosphoribosyl 1,2-cyclic phosphate phosphodiesterase [Mesonia maritima]